MSLLIIILLLVSIAGNVLFLFMVKSKEKQIDVANSILEKLATEKSENSIEFLNKQKNLEETELLARLVRQSPNAIMIMDKDGDILLTNQGFNEMYEYNYKEFIMALGTNYRQTSFSPDVQNRLDTVENTKRPYRYEALNITRTGKELWTQTALMPILDDDGEISHMATIDTDIHQRVTQSDSVISKMGMHYERIDNLAKQFKFLEGEFTNLFQSITELYGLIENTDQILKFIKEISDQTRILGLNASIEAGRAGEHGRGFRVITNEIIGISEKTIHSITQIKDILSSINKKQDELIERKAGSELNIVDYHNFISVLKKEVRDIEVEIAELKLLS